MDNLEELITQAEKSEQEKQFFTAFHYYKQALELALRKPDKDTIKKCKAKMVEMGKKSGDEFQELNFEQHIPTEEIEKGIKPILQGDSLQRILFNLARYKHLFPIKEDVQRQAAKTIPISYQIASTSTLSEKGHLIANGDDPTYSWYMKMYSISQGLISTMYLNPIFGELKKFTEDQKRFDAETLFIYFESSPVCPPESLALFKAGIERYFSQDYIAALHILVPQFENLFLYISEKVGIDVIAINRGKGLSTNPRVLSIALLDTEECKQKWNPNFCEQIKFILLDPLGYKLRHKIAHGEIQPSECNLSNCNLILYLLLVILGRLETKEMVSKVEIAVRINRPINEVFDFTINPENTPKWIDGIIEEQVDKRPIGKGTIYRNKGIDGPWTEYEVIEFEPNKLFTLKKKHGTYHVRYSYQSIEDDKSTILTYLEWAEEGGIKEPFTEATLQKLKNIMET